MQTIITKYGIPEGDIFNFDKREFMISIVSIVKFVIASKKGYKPKVI